MNDMAPNEQPCPRAAELEEALKLTRKALELCDENGWAVAGIGLSAARDALETERDSGPCR